MSLNEKTPSLKRSWQAILRHVEQNPGAVVYGFMAFFIMCGASLCAWIVLMPATFRIGLYEGYKRDLVREITTLNSNLDRFNQTMNENDAKRDRQYEGILVMLESMYKMRNDK